MLYSSRHAQTVVQERAVPSYDVHDMTQSSNSFIGKNVGSSTGASAASGAPFTVQQVEKFTVVEFRNTSLMDAIALEEIGQSLYRLIDAEDRRRIVLDFEKVQYISSQAIGIVLTMNKKLGQLPNSKLVLCGVGSRLAELLKITRLDRLLTIKPTQREAVRVV
jgi:anti-sigma B factor antagonist